MKINGVIHIFSFRFIKESQQDVSDYVDYQTYLICLVTIKVFINSLKKKTDEKIFQIDSLRINQLLQ